MCVKSMCVYLLTTFKLIQNSLFILIISKYISAMAIEIVLLSEDQEDIDSLILSDPSILESQDIIVINGSGLAIIDND